MSSFGQIPTNLICRFSELTKTEIIVVSYLYAVRNRSTNQCNPSRGAIARAVNIAKPHVSTAVKSLEDKEWIFEHPDGSFQLTEPSQRVTKSVTVGVTESVTGGLRISTTGVTDSVSKGYEIRNSLNKEIEHTKNIEEEHIETAIAVAVRPSSTPTESLFQFWVETFALRGAKFTPKRKRNVQNRLKEGYSVDDLKQAVLGCSVSPYHGGENATGTVYHDLELICRSGEKVESFQQIYERHQKGLLKNGTPKQSYQAERADRAIQSRNRTAEIKARVAHRDAELTTGLLGPRLLVSGEVVRDVGSEPN